MPTPGTTKVHRLAENDSAVELDLSAADIAELTKASDRADIQGAR